METSQSPFERYLTPVAVLLGAGLIALAVAYGGGAPKEPVAQNFADLVVDVANKSGADGKAAAALADEKGADYNARIAASRDQGAELGVTGTPTIIMGNEVVAGLDPNLFAKLDAAIAAPAAQPATALISRVAKDGEPFVGSLDAPVTIAYYFDYRCGYCHQFMQTVMPQLYRDYVETGKVRIVFKDFQFLSPDSVAGGVFGRALWELSPEKHFDWFMAMGQA